MTVRYGWNDSDGPPVLNGLCGTLVNVLDALLVNGYGNHASQGWSILNNANLVTISGFGVPFQCTGTNTGGSATTLIDTATNFKAAGVIFGMCVYVAGYGPAVISNITTTTNANDTLTFAAGGPNMTSSGQTYYILSNRRAYKQPAGSNGMIFRVEDTGMGLATNGHWGSVYGFEQFTKFVTGLATGGGTTSLIDTTHNFVTDGVVVGNIVRLFISGVPTGGQITNAVITSITTTTNPNDTLNFTAGTNTPTFASGCCYCIDVGINVFPGTAQLSTDAYPLGGGTLMKSQTNNGTTTWWWMFANGKIFHFVHDPYTSNQYNNCTTFGDIFSYKYGADPYCTILKTDNGLSYPGNFPALCALSATQPGNWMARTAAGIGTAIRVGIHTDFIKNGGVNYMGQGGLTYPHGVDGSLVLAPIWIHESAAIGVRGILPGVWSPMHAKGILNTGDTFAGVASLPGRTFEYISNMGASYSCVFETSPTW